MDPGDEKTDPDRAESEALALAEALLATLEMVVVPSAGRNGWLPERLSFLLARDNYRQCLAALRAGRDVTAGALARALFEEAIRWSWVDEDQPARRMAFVSAAARRHRQLEESVRDFGIDASMFYGPIVSEVVAVPDQAPGFPRQIEGQLEWGLGDLSAMMYAQYRLLSQYTHSSLLASASAAQVRDGELVVGRLPVAARLTVLRNAVANMSVIVNGCKAGLHDDRPTPRTALNLEALGIAVQVAEFVYPFAPATD